ncbi:hypothetical protein PC116_g12059 [Phytophthora cactorum]|nr:hypothetical protein PC114_g16837 [Phytophthora cactorum]KAG2921510.1 hypothetical protein PC117_g16213 [Phytophthora cactorum]KAG3021004.1 hypothetical protein PC120_g8937 [Phytophthora cactorum]KAG3166932.1 hypothetical protein C6341_g11864 [Phytophthora cactorum]KAG4239959.1 hypothetical protein PC116_g12059 [Phytophthora cactorum]
MNAAFLNELTGFFGESCLLMLPEVVDVEDASTDSSLSPLSSTFDQIDNDIAQSDAVNLQRAAPGLEQMSDFKSKDAQRRSMYREREKKLRRDLRHQVDILSAELKILLNRKAGGAIECAQASSIPVSMWKALAILQRGARLEAETEQRKLLEAVSARAAMIEDLHGFVGKRVMEARLTNHVVSRSQLSLATKRMRVEPTDSILYEVFTQQIDALYSQTDKVMRDCGMNSITCGSLNFRPTRKTQDGAEYFQYAWKQMIPLNLQHTRRELWQAAHMLHRQDCREVYTGADSGNTIAVKFRIKSYPGSTLSLSEHIVVRRFDEEDRTILVWRSLTEGNGSLSGMHSDKTGWCIIRPVELGTIKETYVRQVPIHFNRDHKAQDISQFTILIHRSSEEDGIAIAQGISNMNIHDSVPRSVPEEPEPLVANTLDEALSDSYALEDIDASHSFDGFDLGEALHDPRDPVIDQVYGFPQEV